MKFLNAAEAYKADIMILGGDLTGKSVVPIATEQDGSFKASFLGQEWNGKNRAEREQLERIVRASGAYPYAATREEISQIFSEKEGQDEVFKRLMTETIKRWGKTAREKLHGRLQIYVTGGNDDPFFIDRMLQESDVFHSCEGQVVQLTPDHEMISTGYTNLTPWKCPRDISEEDLLARIEAMCDKVDSMARCVFNFHCPPVDSGLDTCPLLDDSVNPPQLVYKSGQLMVYGAGSKAVREVIEKREPLLTLHGHIHESRASTKIRRSLCINPGSEYGEGILRGVIVNIEADKVKSFQFTSG